MSFASHVRKSNRRDLAFQAVVERKRDECRSLLGTIGERGGAVLARVGEVKLDAEIWDVDMIKDLKQKLGGVQHRRGTD